MKPIYHITSSFVVSNLIYFIYHSLGVAIVSFIFGILIDADHILEYFIQHEFTFDLNKIYKYCATFQFKKVYLIFHSLEFIFILWVLLWILKLNLFWLAIAIGITQHMVMDLIFNNKFVFTYTYFISYRIKKGFQKQYLARDTWI